MRKLVIAVAALAAAASLTAASASAASTATVSVIGCVYNHGGQETVPAGSTVSFRLGWAARTAGMDSMFLSAETTTAAVDGTPVPGADGYWGAPGPNPNGGGYLTTWLYPTGITLAAGESLTLTMDVTLSHPVTDGYGRPTAGSIFGGPVTCTVTGA